MTPVSQYNMVKIKMIWWDDVIAGRRVLNYNSS